MSTINGTANSDYLYGTLGIDRIYTNGGSDTVFAGDGDDEINGYLTNFEANTWVYWSTADSLLVFGQGGNDFIIGSESADFLYGGDGDDYIVGYGGNDYIYGNDGNDTLFGLYGNNFLSGGDGNDFITTYSETGTNELYGDGGNDNINGGTGNDVLDGGLGDDTLNGYAGDDSLSGGDGDDRLSGDEGNDTLTGGAGYDELYGGAGDDTYYVTDLEDYIYDSSGSDTAIVSVSFAKIPTSIETVTYINGALALPYWISALVSDTGNGSRYKNLLGATKTFSYSFPDSIPAYNTDTEDANGYTGLNVAQQYNSIALLNTLPEFIDVYVSKTSNHDSLNTISIALNDQVASAGYAQYPWSDSYGSDIFLNNVPNNSTLNPGTYGAYTITHELGHALGLKHPFDEPDASGNIPDPPYLQGNEDQAKWAMMSYTSTSNEYKLEFSELDIAALQYLYGPSATARTGDDTYYYDATSANFIWDGGGEDTLSAASSANPVAINLTPGYWGYGGNTKADTITSAGQITVNFGTTIENLIGSIYADTLTGNGANNEINGSNGDDIIYGGAGNDALDYTFVNGNDTLYGGPGNDTYYVYSSSGSDTFIEYLDEGYDRIFTSISYSIKNISNIEYLFSFNSIEEDIELTGNSLNNYIKSSDGNCVIDGGLGSDYAWYSWDYSYDDCSIYIENGDLKVRKGNGSIDILKNIEYIIFSDRNIDLSTASITSLDTTYSLTAVSSTADEGQSALFSLVTTNLVAGTSIAYTLSGVSASDLVSNSLTGTAIVSDSGTTAISLPLAADALTEGAETLTITLDDSPDTAASLTVVDTSISSSYKLSAVYDSRDEGSTAYFSLVASGVDAGTVVAYTISGVSASDLVSGSLSRTITTAAAGESKLISIPIRKDNLTEGTETLTVTLDDSSDTTASLLINDTSKGATYSITSGSESYDEGQSALFSLVTTNLVAGTSVAYTLSGVSASDLVSNSLTGTATVSATGTTVISLPLAADALTEGDETLTITLDDSSSTTASLVVNDTSISPSYKLSVYISDSEDEGSTAYFLLVASGVDAGTVVAYTISGVSASDLVSSSLNGTITTTADEYSLISIPIRKDNLTEGSETLTITLDDSSSTTASLVVNDTSKGATYSITSGADSYDEGQSALFSLVTTNLVAGTSIAYTLSGVSASDLESNSLTGTATVSATGTTVMSLPLAADALTEGAETLTATLDEFSDKTASVTINDTSTAPTYSITSGSESYDEGQSALFSLVTTNLVAGTSVAYTFSGVSASDLVSNSLTGTATVSASGTTIISLPLAADSLTEGAETLTVTLDGSSDTTASLMINDSSKTPVVDVTLYRTTILGDKNILGPDPVLIKALTENITKTDGVITEQFFLYAGARYDYSDIDSLITVVTRNGEFTSEFSQEIADYAASFENATYSDIVKIVGSSGIDEWLITVAGDDGSYVS